MKNLIFDKFFYIFSRKIFQPIFEILHKLSLAGMNYGGGGYVTQSGELFVIRSLNDLLDKNRTLIVFDVGANIGNYSEEVIKYLGSSVDVFAFEPAARTFQVLKSRFTNTPNVHSIQLGFGEMQKKVKLYSDTNSSELASVYQRQLSHIGVELKRSEEISITTIDAFCSSQHISAIDFLKLDIEGNEYSALLGAKNMLKKKAIHIIQFEFGGCNLDSRTYFKDFYYLLSQDFNLYRLVQDGIVLIRPYKELNEVFVTTNYLAVLK